MNLNHEIKSGLHFSLTTIQHGEENISFLQKHQHNITLTCIFSLIDFGLHSNSNNHIHNIQFAFHRHYLESFSGGNQNLSLQHFPHFQQHELCCNTQMILHDILNCKLHGAFRNMFLESKALALLLCFQKCYIKEENGCEGCKFLTNKIEKDKILKAKQILLTRLNNPPTIPELSVAIGINQCYLKKGFKEIFGTTVYDFVQEQRMLKAKLLLTTTDHTVSQVAEQIGFSSQSSFSNAFKKFTGIFPSEIQNN